jgi:hypothetical protein
MLVAAGNRKFILNEGVLMAARASHRFRTVATALIGLLSIGLSLEGATAIGEELPLGDVELRRKTGAKKAAFLKGTIKSIDNDTLVLQQPGKVLPIRLRDVSGIRYQERYTEPLVGEELPIKFIRDDKTGALVRHKVAVEVGRWSIQQSVDVDQVTITRFGRDYSGGLSAVSVTGNVERNAEIATASTTVKNLASRTVKVWIRLLIESDTLKGYKEHEFELGPNESDDIMIAFTSAGHQVRRVTTDDIQNKF